MAIVRCQDHPPRNTNYFIAVKPVGYPETALICGRENSDHEEIGWVYLLPEEHEEYQEGKRVFGLWGPDSPSTAAKVRVSDQVVEGLNKWNKEKEESALASSHNQVSTGTEHNTVWRNILTPDLEYL